MVQMRSNAQVTVDVGFLLKTRVSLGAVKDLALTFGDKVNVDFAAESLNVFSEDNNE
jgi:hypothetical protein